MASVKNPRGYAYTAFRRSYQRHMGYAWFATLNKSRLTPTLNKWLYDGLNMYDRMVFDIDPYVTEELWELVGTIEKAMSRSVMANAKGRIKWPHTEKGIPGYDRMALTLDTLPLFIDEGAGTETAAERIPEPSDPYAELDDWAELADRIRQLLPLLTAAEQRYVGAQVDDPQATCRELGERFGQSRQYADLMLRRVRAKAKTLAESTTNVRL